jgi:hypothetical protein
MNPLLQGDELRPTTANQNMKKGAGPLQVGRLFDG